ncbi:hypothetical protein BRC63_08435, partial [Halobacteriales archaeon QH_10_70_21]
RSGVTSSRPTVGRSRGSTFACDGPARFGTCGQDGEAAGLVPAILHESIGFERFESDEAFPESGYEEPVRMTYERAE